MYIEQCAKIRGNAWFFFGKDELYIYGWLLEFLIPRYTDISIINQILLLENVKPFICVFQI